MHNEVNIPSKKWKCSILHKRCPFFSAEQTVRRWRSDGGRPQSDLGWLRSLTNHQHPWLARNVLSGQRNIDFKIECVHYFYSILCTPLGQCGGRWKTMTEIMVVRWLWWPSYVMMFFVFFLKVTFGTLAKLPDTRLARLRGATNNPAELNNLCDRFSSLLKRMYFVQRMSQDISC